MDNAKPLIQHRTWVHWLHATANFMAMIGALFSLFVSGVGPLKADASNEGNPSKKTSKKTAANLRNMTEDELLTAIPRLPEKEKSKALAALYSRFAPGRKLNALADWRGLWSRFPKTHFRSAHVPYTGPSPFKGDIGGFFVATVTVESGSGERLHIQLALSVALDDARFEGILRGISREDFGSEVLDVRCVSNDGSLVAY